MATRGIATIQPEDDGAPIEAKILRQWESHGMRAELCYLLVDRQNSAIQAFASYKDKVVFDKRITVGQCYQIRQYSSLRARKTLKVVLHQANLVFGRETIFDPINANDFPTHHFNFKSYEDLPATLENNDQLIDFVGRLICVKADILTSSGRRLLKIDLEDSSEKCISIAMWTEIASKVNKLLILRAPYPTILAVTSLKHEIYQGLQLTSTSGTHMYINPTVPQSAELASIFQTRYNEVSINLRNQTPIGTLTRSAAAQQQLGDTFWCHAWIKSYSTDRDWYYNGCTICKKHSTLMAGSFRCVDHSGQDICAPIYRVNATLQDETGTIQATFFDDGMYSATGKTCEQLINAEENDNHNEIPSTLSQLIKQPKIFHIQPNSRNLQPTGTFIVKQTFPGGENTNTPPSITSLPEPHNPTVDPNIQRQLFQAEGTSSTKKSTTKAAHEEDISCMDKKKAKLE